MWFIAVNILTIVVGCKESKPNEDPIVVEENTGACDSPTWYNIPLDLDDSWDNELTGVWGPLPGELHLIGVEGQHLRGGPESWEQLSAAGSQPRLDDLWGIADDDLFGINEEGEIWRYDGQDWSEEDIDLSSAWLHAISASSTDDVYVVGWRQDNFSSGFAYHRDANGWSEITLPPATKYWDVHVKAKDDVWVVGDEGYIAHFNGLTWTKQNAVTNRSLKAVWAVRSDLVFAAGGDWEAYTDEGQGTLLMFDGTEWSVIDNNSWTVFDSIWGHGSNDVWAVGDVPDEEDPDGRVWYFDGVTWTEQDSIWNSPSAIWGTGPKDVYVVGYGGSSGEDLQRYGCQQ